jgi:glycosyltransferase involved in cell wall biosynthesis
MDVVWFAEIKWDYLKTRKQQIIRRKPNDVRLLYLEPYVKGRTNRYGLRREGDIFCATVPFIKNIPNASLRWLLDQNWERSIVDRVARHRVSRVMHEAGFVPAGSGLVLSNVYAIRVASRIPGRFLLYDCNDAHSDFPGMPSWTRDYFEQSCQLADAVNTSSQSLYADVTRLRGGEAGCEIIGNGVEFEHFRRVRETLGRPIPPDPPRIGYLGAIAPWFNFEFVERLARTHPDWEVVLVGPVILGVEEQVARLSRYPNVTLRDPVAYEEVPALLYNFTVGVIPFRYDALTRGVNPNKMYEYLAMGLPVVASRFSTEVQQYSGVVEAPETAGDFVRACESFVSLARDDSVMSSHREKAWAIAEKHDWGLIAERFWTRVRDLVAV